MICLIQLIQSSDHNFSHLLGKEFEFSFRRNEFSMISPQGNRSILLKPCGETVKFSTRRNENSISSPKWIEEFRKEQWSNFISDQLFNTAIIDFSLSVHQFWQPSSHPSKKFFFIINDNSWIEAFCRLLRSLGYPGSFLSYQFTHQPGVK